MAKKTDFKAEFEKQRAAGIDIENPMNNLITKPGAKPKKAKPATQPTATAKNKGKARTRSLAFVPVLTERRVRRVQLVFTPELYERTKAAADEAGLSFNELINQMCDRFIK